MSETANYETWLSGETCTCPACKAERGEVLTKRERLVLTRGEQLAEAGVIDDVGGSESRTARRG